jgi:hypothetical protein
LIKRYGVLRNLTKVNQMPDGSEIVRECRPTVGGESRLQGCCLPVPRPLGNKTGDGGNAPLLALLSQAKPCSFLLAAVTAPSPPPAADRAQRGAQSVDQQKLGKHKKGPASAALGCRGSKCGVGRGQGTCERGRRIDGCWACVLSWL